MLPQADHPSEIAALEARRPEASRPDVQFPAPATGRSAELPTERAASQAAATPPTRNRGYRTVTVFYATDRQAVDVNAPQKFGHVGWFLLTAMSAATTLVLAIMIQRYSAKRLLVIAGGAALAATLVLGIITVVSRLQTPVVATRPGRVYGPDRGEMELGTCQVSIPESHQTGEVERPSIFRLEFQEDPERHVVLLNVAPEKDESFFAALKARVNTSAKKEVFVFVHGFNVSFDTAARRTAQIAYDLKFEGAPILYSWPSQGNLLDYTVDETNVVWTVPHLKGFLLNVAQRSGAKSLHLVAHSMGNRALTAALQSLSYELKDSQPMFNEVVLTAPDIDADVFRRDIAPAIVKTASRVTLYASSNDEALALSKKVHGYPRAGESGESMVVVPGIDTIDVSTVDSSLIGHSYYGSNGTVLADLLDLLHDSKPPGERRWLRPMQLGILAYWTFVADRNPANAASPPEGIVR
jgi:esterase/lipase superfamily enzyme